MSGAYCWLPCVNDKADDLSRNKLSAFLSKVPDADSSSSVTSCTTSLQSASLAGSGLAVSQLRESVQFYFEQGSAPSTIHSALIKQLLKDLSHDFCTRYSLYNPFSVSKQLHAMSVRDLSGRRSSSTIS